ncbi:MAG: hypothetical protein ACKVPJ_13650 [Chitinophagales bacterium]
MKKRIKELPPDILLAEKEDLFLPWMGAWHLRPNIQYYMKSGGEYSLETTNAVGMKFLESCIAMDLIFVHTKYKENRLL